MEVHIYIGTDSKAPRVQPRKYGYVLACTLKGKLATKQEFKETTERKSWGESTLIGTREARIQYVDTRTVKKSNYKLLKPA